ncbi:hypothetical protein cyc_00197 [Cyclospora cayetanensis]|uniref:PIH1D1/2/3 CS-like domain-containing protein n=1 Tax=Cyclospora cayetanensis TaxID=88456 RepID=A0A1D3D6A2_9EIME|nr:hypothetical protein cyc_00197 [Cyclospora cayetanensis]
MGGSPSLVSLPTKALAPNWQQFKYLGTTKTEAESVAVGRKELKRLVKQAKNKTHIKTTEQQPNHLEHQDNQQDHQQDLQPEQLLHLQPWATYSVVICLCVSGISAQVVEKPNRPEALRVEISVPTVARASEIVVEWHASNRLALSLCKSPEQNIVIPLPFDVERSAATAKFLKAKRVLKVQAPVVAAASSTKNTISRKKSSTFDGKNVENPAGIGTTNPETDESHQIANTTVTLAAPAEASDKETLHAAALLAPHDADRAVDSQVSGSTATAEVETLAARTCATTRAAGSEATATPTAPQNADTGRGIAAAHSAAGKTVELAEAGTPTAGTEAPPTDASTRPEILADTLWTASVAAASITEVSTASGISEPLASVRTALEVSAPLEEDRSTNIAFGSAKARVSAELRPLVRKQLDLLQCSDGHQNILLFLLLPQQQRPVETMLSLSSNALLVRIISEETPCRLSVATAATLAPDGDMNTKFLENQKDRNENSRLFEWGWAGVPCGPLDLQQYRLSPAAVTAAAERFLDATATEVPGDKNATTEAVATIASAKASAMNSSPALAGSTAAHAVLSAGFTEARGDNGSINADQVLWRLVIRKHQAGLWSAPYFSPCCTTWEELLLQQSQQELDQEKTGAASELVSAPTAAPLNPDPTKGFRNETTTVAADETTASQLPLGPLLLLENTLWRQIV